MIVDSIIHAGSYIQMFSGARSVFAFLKSLKPSGFKEGRTDFQRDVVYATLMNREMHGDESRLEVHRQFVDLQYIVSGTDVFGWRAIETCRRPAATYDDSRDILFYGDRPDTLIPVASGMFIVLFPGDAHAPLAGHGLVRKAVVKIALPALLGEFRRLGRLR